MCPFIFSYTNFIPNFTILAVTVPDEVLSVTHALDRRTVPNQYVPSTSLKMCLTRSGSYNDPQGGAIFDPRGKIGRIYVELHMTMLYIKYTSFVSCCCRMIFSYISIISLW